MATETIGGTVYLKVNGQQYSLEGEMSVQPATTKNNKVIGPDGSGGTHTVAVVPYIEGTLWDLGGLSIQTLSQVDDATVTAELNNGKVYTLIGACFAAEPKVETVSGKVNFRFEGDDCDEQVAS